ncbi:Inositol polyphosphate 4-phosphatase type II [Actinomortierella wolfii]|nr:Inositol polyphosphate 4-phosphatase type II [Actinomortierella wolfii]
MASNHATSLLGLSGQQQPLAPVLDPVVVLERASPSTSTSSTISTTRPTGVSGIGPLDHDKTTMQQQQHHHRINTPNSAHTHPAGVQNAELNHHPHPHPPAANASSQKKPASQHSVPSPLILQTRQAPLVSTTMSSITYSSNHNGNNYNSQGDCDTGELCSLQLEESTSASFPTPMSQPDHPSATPRTAEDTCIHASNQEHTAHNHHGLRRESSSFFRPPPVQLRASIRFDPDQHYDKLVKGKVQVVLVLTAFVRLDTPPSPSSVDNGSQQQQQETPQSTTAGSASADSPPSTPPHHQAIWIELCRTEMMTMDKGSFDGHFVTVLPLQIQEHYLVIGFTLLAVPPSSVQSKDLPRSPALDGLMPWAEASVAIEHFVIHPSTWSEATTGGGGGSGTGTGSGSHGDDKQDVLDTIDEEDNDFGMRHRRSGSSSHRASSGYTGAPTILQVPLVEVELTSRPGLRKSKRTVATLTVIADRILPKIPRAKVKKELGRTGPSFTQTYYGHSVRGTVIYGRETLYESPIAFTFPQSLLRVYAENEARVLRQLEQEPNAGFAEMIQRMPTTTMASATGVTANNNIHGNKAAARSSRLGRRPSFLDALRRGATRGGAPKAPPKDVHAPSPSTLPSPFSASVMDPNVITARAPPRVERSTKVRQQGLMAEDLQMQKMRRQQTGIHRNVKMYYERMLKRLDQKIQENMASGQGMFRRSSEKREEALQWVPLNCCVQEFFVHTEGLQTNYQTTTVGAAAAHAAGFSRTNLDSLAKKIPMGMYWDKVEQGNTFKEDFHSLEQVLAESYKELKRILDDSSEHPDRERAKAIAKEIQFVNDSMVALAVTVLNEFLSPLSLEGSAKCICDEMWTVIAKMQEIRVLDEQQQSTQDEEDAAGQRRGEGLTRSPPQSRLARAGIFQSSRRQESQDDDMFANTEPAVEEIVRYSKELFGWLELAIEHECLAVDARYVASADWTTDRIPRDAAFSQCLTSLVTAFVALLEEWWVSMSTQMERCQQRERRRSRQSLTAEAKQKHSCSSATLVEAEVILPLQDTQDPDSTVFSPSQSSDLQRKASRSKPSSRRNSVRSVGSTTSSSNASLSGAHKSARLFRRSSRRTAPTRSNPLKDDPAADAQNKRFWDKLIHLGWLVQVESLLSTQGSELGMLLDYAIALSDIRDSVQFGFHCMPVPPPSSSPAQHQQQQQQQHPHPHDCFSPKPSSATSAHFSPPSRTSVERNEPVVIEDDTIQISGRRGALTVSFGLEPAQFALLPESLQSGASKIKVHTVLFTQGINEMQTLSNLTGKHPVQSYINEQGLAFMQDYVSQYHLWLARAGPLLPPSEACFSSVTSDGHPLPGTAEPWATAPGITKGTLRHPSRHSPPEWTPKAGGDGQPLPPQRYVSNMSQLTDWDLVSPSSVDAWFGELLVNDLLADLELAVLGHPHQNAAAVERDDLLNSRGTPPPLSSSPAVSLGESDQVSVVASSLGPSRDTGNNSEAVLPRSPPLSSGTTATAAATPLPASSSFLGSMTFSFFGGRATKDITILSAAEALTRALGHVPSPALVDTWEDGNLPTSPTITHRRSSVNAASTLAMANNNNTTANNVQTSDRPHSPLPPLWTTSHIKSCKSAKDRTSMAVTLSQVNLLRMCHGLEMSPEQRRDHEDDWQAILDAMRSEVGVRIKNVERNLKLGDFAVDLLWLSAFGSNGNGSGGSVGMSLPPQPPMHFGFGPVTPSTPFPAQVLIPPGVSPLEYYPMTYDNHTDALSAMRSLLPDAHRASAEPRTSGNMQASGILHSVLDRHHELDSGPLVLIEHEDAQSEEDQIQVDSTDEQQDQQGSAEVVETGQDEESNNEQPSHTDTRAQEELQPPQHGSMTTSQSTPTFVVSPTLHESPPPPPTLRLVKSLTGSALRPVLVTSEASTTVGSATGSNSPLTRSGSASPLLVPTQQRRLSTDGVLIGSAPTTSLTSGYHGRSASHSSSMRASTPENLLPPPMPQHQQQQQYVSFPDAFEEPMLRTRLARTLGFDTGGGEQSSAMNAANATSSAMATTGTTHSQGSQSRPASPPAPGTSGSGTKSSAGLGLGLGLGLGGFGQLFTSGSSTPSSLASGAKSVLSTSQQHQPSQRVTFSTDVNNSTSSSLPSPTARKSVFAHRTTPSWSSQQSSQYQELQRREQETLRIEKIKRGLRLMRTFSGIGGGDLNGRRGVGGSGGDRHAVRHEQEQEHHLQQQYSPRNGSIGSLQEMERLALSPSNKAGRIVRKRGKYAFNRVQYKFLPPSYRPPKRMTSDLLES